jgi:Xaa-Pro dipeptidase
MREHKFQLFSLDEYQGRLGALRSRMAEKNLDALMVTTPENLFYLTGYQTPGYYWYQTLIVPADKDPVFVTRRLESVNIEPTSWVEDSRPYDDRQDWMVHTGDVLRDMGLDRKRIGFDERSWFVTVDDFRRLSAAITDATLADAYGLVEAGRLVKSPQEVEYIRQAAKAADAGMLAGIEASVVGATDSEVAAAVHSAQILAGSEYTGLPVFVAPGFRSNMVHATWGRHRIGPNEAVMFEMPGCVNRYHAAFFRIVFLGDPPDEWIRGAELSMKALEYAKSVIKPGVVPTVVFEAVQEMMAESGLGIRTKELAANPSSGPSGGGMSGSGGGGKVAYSIGIGFAPDWGEGNIYSFSQDENRPLQAGMTFHLNPSNTKVPGYGRAGCSDTIVVTEDGCETLTSVERKLYIKK